MFVFWIFCAIKNTPKIKVLQMPYKFNMIFLEYLRISGTENTSGGASTWPRGSRARPTPWARPLPRGPHVGPLHLSLHPHTSSASSKNHPPAQTRVLAHLPAIFDILAQSPIHKTALGDCSLVCDSSNGPISSFSIHCKFLLPRWPCSWACMSNLYGPK